MNETKIYKPFLILLFLHPLVFNPFGYKVFVYAKIAYISLIALLLLTLWVVKSSQDEVIFIKKDTFIIPITLFFFTLILSTIFSMHKLTSFRELFIIFITILCYFLIVNLSNKDDIKLFISIIVIVGFLVSVYGIIQRYGIDLFPWGKKALPMPISTIGLPSFLSAYLAIITPFALMSVIIQKRITYKIFYLIALFTILICMLFTYGRAGYLATAVVFLIFVFSSKKRLKVGLLILLLLIISLIIIYPTKFFSNTVKPYILMKEVKAHTTKTRIYWWRDSLYLFRLNPVIGSGVDTYRLIYPKQRSVEILRLGNLDFLPVKAHNEFLQIATTCGSLGLFSYLLLIITFFKKLINKLNNEIIFAIFLAFIAFLIQAFFTQSFEETYLFFWIIFSFGSIYSTNEEKYIKFVFKKYNIFFVAILVIVLLPSCISPLIADTFYLRAMYYREKEMWDKTLIEFSRMLKYETKNDFYHKEVGLTYRSLAKGLKNKELMNKAINRYKKAVRINPYDATNYASLALAYLDYAKEFDYRKLDDSIKYFKKAIYLDKKYPVFRNKLGEVYLVKEQYDNAIAEFKYAIELTPNYIEPYINLSIGYLKKDMVDEAKKVLKEALKIEPNNKRIKDLLYELE